MTLLPPGLGINPYDSGFTIYSKIGLEIVYLYFQLPLMVLIIAPAIDGLRREWREASENMGATTFQFWRYVALPILMPSLLGSMILLFGNAFGAQATAYQLTGGFIDLVTILIGDQLTGDVLHNKGLGTRWRWGWSSSSASRSSPTSSCSVARSAGSDDEQRDQPARSGHRGDAGRVARPPRGAGAQVPVAIRVVGHLHHRRHLLLPAPRRDVRLLAPSGAALVGVHGDPRGPEVLREPGLLASSSGSSPSSSASALLVPTAFWVRLRLPRARPYVEFVTLLPFVIPPIVLVFGLISTLQPPAAAVHPYRHREHGAPRLRLRRAVVPVHVPGDRHGPAGDGHPEPDRGRTEPRCRLAQDPDPGHPAEPARRAAERSVPDPRHRRGRVHDRDLPCPQGLLGLPVATGRHRPVPAVRGRRSSASG